MRCSTVLFLSVALAGALSAQNVTVQVGGKTVGTRGAINFQPGNGSIQNCMDEPTANRVTCTSTADSAYFVTRESWHENQNYCLSTSKSPNYACELPRGALSYYPTGMVLLLVPDVTCMQVCSLDIHGLGPKFIKRADGTADAGGALMAGRPYWLFFDGNVFRLMTGTEGGGAAPAAESTRERDSIARRFISSMETMNYAPSISLEVTAGDIHKTVTSNAVGNATINAATGGLAGQHMWIIVVNDQISAKTITFGANLRSAGPLVGAAGKAATLQFVSDGTTWYEVARTANL